MRHAAGECFAGTALGFGGGLGEHGLGDDEFAHQVDELVNFFDADPDRRHFGRSATGAASGRLVGLAAAGDRHFGFGVVGGAAAAVFNAALDRL